MAWASSFVAWSSKHYGACGDARRANWLLTPQARALPSGVFVVLICNFWDVSVPMSSFSVMQMVVLGMCVGVMRSVVWSEKDQADGNIKNAA